jgi:hypothetical protein
MDLQKMKTIILHSNDVGELRRMQVTINEMICNLTEDPAKKSVVDQCTTLYGICKTRIRLLSKPSYLKNRMIIEKARFFMPAKQFRQAEHLAKNI